MKTSSRKIAYVLGAGFSFASNHSAPVGNHLVHMPLQFSLFEELCRFHYRKIKRLDKTAKAIREYFNPNTYRATRGKGSSRHQDLFGLSVEEVVTFFDEIVTNKKKGFAQISSAAEELQRLTVELISYLSVNGGPGQNKLLKLFAKRLVQTDVIVTFNWDTILDQVLSNQVKYQWHPSWGYGKTVRTKFNSSARNPPPIPNKYPRLLKLHGSINWIAFEGNSGTKRAITRGWYPGDRPEDVVMMPPKMIKPEIWGRQTTGNLLPGSGGNNKTSEDFYPRLWIEAEEQLALCRRIVFVGYSFPPADFAVSNMLRRAVSARKMETGSFPDVDIVDPNSAELARRFEQSFKIKVSSENQYLSLRNYLSSNRAK
jgi:SIR2-like domain